MGLVNFCLIDYKGIRYKAQTLIPGSLYNDNNDNDTSFGFDKT